MNFKKRENNEHAHPFWHVSKVYCAKCSKRKLWKEAEVSGFRKDNINHYRFNCHGELFEIDCDSFIENNRINGPSSRSFIVFNKESES